MTPDLSDPFDPRHGYAVPIAPGVVRVTAPNAGPFTSHGTNSYLIGEQRLALVDPGPDDDAHLAALMRAADGRRVEAILLTHTHRDHSDLARRAQVAFHAPIFSAGPHRLFRPLHESETNPLDAAGDFDLVPDRLLADGEVVAFDSASIRVVATPGHAANHVAFAVDAGPGAGTLFSGDHVMAWSTTIVAPPDGSMRAYLRSLDTLLARDDRLYLPGHGAPVSRPHATVRALRAHRQLRETAIVEALRAGERTVATIVARIYRTTPSHLHGAAGLSVLAHLEDMHERGLIRSNGPPLLNARFEPA